jgi:glycosyltransferase involved in cell wall biosynthesis
LHEAISSVADQTYNNIEIVIIDDCSTEKFTIDVLKELKNSGYKVIDLEKNSGPSIPTNSFPIIFSIHCGSKDHIGN